MAFALCVSALSAAFAQDEAPLPTPPAPVRNFTAAPPQPPEGARAYDMAELCGGRALSEIRASSQLRQLRTSRAVVDCALSGEFRLLSCQVIEEEPRNNNAGLAAVLTSCAFQPGEAGRPLSGASVHFYHPDDSPAAARARMSVSFRFNH
ncbi:MAG TPA: hypothetical protein PLS69_01355 [Terricaulis sp.]|nr:hypothetical protein [Terricaulis sp.]